MRTHLLCPLIAAIIGLVACWELPAEEDQTNQAGQQLAAPAFTPAAAGCATAHCDVSMSDRAALAPPTASSTTTLWNDPAPGGSNIGLGCVSNGTLAACTYQTLLGGDNLVIYDAEGQRRYASGALLGPLSWTSAPLISAGGEVIAADARHLVRIDPSRPGDKVVWKVAKPDLGVPISPVITKDSVIVLATKGGSVAAFDSRDGRLVGQLTLPAPAGGIYETINTPCVRGQRIYISTQRSTDEMDARLVALDIDPGAAAPLKVAWHVPFSGPSGASPLCVGDTIYFDGDGGSGALARPMIYAVRDHGVFGAVRWKRSVAGKIEASLAHDPRGGLWYFSIGNTWLRRRSLDGQLLDLIDVNALVGDPAALHFPSSVMTIAGDATAPVMLVSASSVLGTSYVIAVDLRRRALLWKAPLPGDWTAAQYAIARRASGAPVVIFPGFFKGAYGVGER